MLDLILRGARIAGRETEGPRDVGVAAGRIAAIAPAIHAEAAEVLDLGGRLLAPGFVETHIHLDKSDIMARCDTADGTLAEAIAATAAAKRSFTEADVYARAARTLRRALLHGTTRMRTHVEVDPGIGLRGFDGVLPLARDYAWAIDLEICVFPQEGLLNNPGTEALMRAALDRGARVVGACPYTDTDPLGQIARVFALARDYDADIDMHLDFSTDPAQSHLSAVCEAAARHGWDGRVTVGHVSTLSALPGPALAQAARRMADAGVALTVLPSTDLYLMGRDRDHRVERGVAPAHRVLAEGVTCALATNNVLNPFTPFGDGSLLRMANLYANIAQAGRPADLADCFDMVTRNAARVMRLPGCEVAVGAPADLAVLDAPDRATAVAELSPVLYAFKRGRRTLERAPARLLGPFA